MKYINALLSIFKRKPEEHLYEQRIVDAEEYAQCLIDNKELMCFEDQLGFHEALLAEARNYNTFNELEEYDHNRFLVPVHLDPAVVDATRSKVHLVPLTNRMREGLPPGEIINLNGSPKLAKRFARKFAKIKQADRRVYVSIRSTSPEPEED